MEQNSCIYTGRVQHRRVTPVAHVFDYPVYLLYLDLDELPHTLDTLPGCGASRAAALRFQRNDYLGDPQHPLQQSVRELCEAETGTAPAGPIRVLTQPRHLGFGFNPVSFYYGFDAGGGPPTDIIAEVHNTPWGETHRYVMKPEPASDGSRALRCRFEKDFHVSPFMPINISYDWRFNNPGERLLVHNETRLDAERCFSVTLDLKRRPLTAAALWKTAARHPLGGAGTLLRIYWQALRLWLKRTPLHAHPRKRPAGRVGDPH